MLRFFFFEKVEAAGGGEDGVEGGIPHNNNPGGFHASYLSIKTIL